MDEPALLTEETTRRGRPAQLTRDQIVEAALRVIDGEGLDGLSMRRLGRELGVSPMAPYGYFDSKKELVRAMLDEVSRGLAPARASTEPWPEQLTMLARRFREALRAHPRLAELFVTAPALGGRAMAAVEDMIAALRRQGVAGDEAVRAVYAVAAYAIGFVAQEVAREGHGSADHRRARLESLPVERFPNLIELAAPASGYAGDAQFESGLAALVLGYQVRLGAADLGSS